MERILLLVGGGLTLLLLVFATLSRVDNPHQGIPQFSDKPPNDAWFQATVLDSSKPVLVDFTATWCGYCKQLAVVLEDIKKNYGDQITVVAVDVDKHPEVAAAYQVNGLPTLMVVKDRKVVAYEPGMMRYETVEQLIQPHLGTAKSASPAAPTEAPPAADKDKTENHEQRHEVGLLVSQ
ncbi:thioredoxin family protein [Planctomicrobium sp. SH661]|uniref:thioredoxin family protein n=1 Tax=Planctomicrobium sp. SH661 TaxID=3448124 RepID=UPI003F5CACDE